MPEIKISKKSKIKKLKRSDITDEMRRKFHVCEHEKVGYSEISKLALVMLKRSKQDANNIKKLSEILISIIYFSISVPFLNATYFFRPFSLFLILLSFNSKYYNNPDGSNLTFNEDNPYNFYT